jgi:hypothetical protein
MKIVLSLILTIISPVLLNNASASTSCYSELQDKKSEFYALTKHSALCSIRECETCLIGVNKLLEISSEDIFPSKNFGTMFIDEDFSDVTTNGFVHVDYKATPAEMRAHLSKQSDEYAILTSLRDQFYTNTEHSALCSTASKAECIEGLKKLVVVSENAPDLFPSNNFSSVFVDHTFTNADTRGFVHIDLAATVEQIEAHLRAQ